MNSDSDWKDVLVGKKIVQGSNVDEKTSFSINGLPPGTRVLKPDSMKTMDYRSDRLNVHVTAEDVCTSVLYG